MVGATQTATILQGTTKFFSISSSMLVEPLQPYHLLNHYGFQSMLIRILPYHFLILFDSFIESLFVLHSKPFGWQGLKVLSETSHQVGRTRLMIFDPPCRFAVGYHSGSRSTRYLPCPTDIRGTLGIFLNLLFKSPSFVPIR